MQQIYVYCDFFLNHFLIQEKDIVQVDLVYFLVLKFNIFVFQFLIPAKFFICHLLYFLSCEISQMICGKVLDLFLLFPKKYPLFPLFFDPFHIGFTQSFQQPVEKLYDARWTRWGEIFEKIFHQTPFKNFYEGYI